MDIYTDRMVENYRRMQDTQQAGAASSPDLISLGVDIGQSLSELGDNATTADLGDGAADLGEGLGDLASGAADSLGDLANGAADSLGDIASGAEGLGECIGGVIGAIFEVIGGILEGFN